MKKRSLNIFDAGIAFVLAFVLSQFTAVIGITITQSIMSSFNMTSAQITSFWDGMWGYLLQGLFMNVAFVGIFVWYYTHRAKTTMLQKPTNYTLKYVGVCIIVGVASLFLLSGTLNYFQLLLSKLNIEPGVLSYEIDTPFKYIVSLISLAVMPAICEELLFRGIITTALKQKGETYAIWISSLMFAIFHFSPSQLIYPMCFGLILSIVYLRTNNIVFPILLHFVNNALSVSIQYFSNSTATAFTHSASMLLYALITLLVWIYIIYRLFKDFQQHKSTQTTINCETEVTTTTNDMQIVENTNFNNKIFYGSIVLMIVIYLLFLI